MKIKLMGLAITAVLLASCGKKDGEGSTAAVVEEEKVLNVYNWSDYIAEDTIAKFEEKTGVMLCVILINPDEAKVSV